MPASATVLLGMVGVGVLALSCAGPDAAVHEQDGAAGEKAAAGTDAAAEAAAPAGAILRTTYDTMPMLGDLALDGAWRYGPAGDRVFVLDRFNHRLLELDRFGEITLQFGQAGQGPGELRFPLDYAVADSGSVYILTPGVVRMSIHRFSPGGEFLDVIHQGSSPEEYELFMSSAIVVDSRGRIYLNQPRQGAVMTRYSAEGELEASIGDLLVPGEVFAKCGEHSLCRDRRFAIRLNRVVTAATRDDALVIAFTAAPIVRRYSADGDLEFETRLRSAFVNELVDVAMQDREAWAPYVSSNLDTDGVNALQIVQGVDVDTESGLVFCLVGGKEIHVLSAGGDQVAVLTPSGQEGEALWSLSAEGGVIWLTSHSKLFGANYPDELFGHLEGLLRRDESR